MLLAGDQFHRYSIDGDLFRQKLTQPATLFIGGSPRAAILHETTSVDGTEITTGGNLPRLQGIITAERFQQSTAKLEFEGIDAEE